MSIEEERNNRRCEFGDPPPYVGLHCNQKPGDHRKVNGIDRNPEFCDKSHRFQAEG